MRPSVLFPLFADISTLRGVGPRMAERYKRLCGQHIIDLLFHLPSGVIDRSYSPKLKCADRDRIATLILNIVEHAPPKKRTLPYRIIGEDGTGQISITYFNAKGDYLANIFPTDRSVAVSGLLERFRGGWTMSHPDYVVPAHRIDEIPKLETVYPLTEGLTSKLVRKTVEAAMARLPDLPEWLDPYMLKREGWPSWKEAVKAAHDGKTIHDANPLPRRRLAYDEMLAEQLALAVIRRYHREAGGREIKGTGVLQNRLKETLPFALTLGQKEALKDIQGDMAAPKRMLRLLQGDVGSGKTIVALIAMLQALESNMQAALMVPTEILARQHVERLNVFLMPLGVKAHLLVGKSRSKERRSTLEGIADGSIKIVVGTHALFQEDVKFQALGLAVIDEQHRFGVQQRLNLADKGKGVDILVMTATPIPRTLTLTAFGDMDVSRLMDKPPGRQPIDTRLINMARMDDVIEGVRRQAAAGAQAYWVCPLVEESEISDLAAASARAETLAERLGNIRVGLVHGRMTTEDKDQVMTAFASGAIKVLVATTVIEVGVDVPNASLMIVEHAERFGLAQLHQLRGRVGRGQTKSICLLVYQNPLGETAKARLKMMRETNDGFRIAEEDLRLRGPGEILGTRQSGLPEYRVADVLRDNDLLDMANKDAQLVLANDSNLTSNRGTAHRLLLYLFRKDASVKLFRS